MNNLTCKNPCTFLISRAITTQDASNTIDFGLLILNFKRNIKVTEAQYLYSELSLIAEVGGYVGLFLGVSVNQVTILVDKLFVYIDL